VTSLLLLWWCACAGPSATEVLPPALDGEVRPDSADGDSDDTGDSGDTAAAFPAVEQVADPHVAHSLTELVVYAVRHAEKDSEGSDPGLTDEGLARAEALAVLLHDVPLDAVYATELQRTQLTVKPTADDHGLPVVTDLDAEEELAPHLLLDHRGDRVLHAGHSYTLTEFFLGLGVADPPDLDGYGQLWIVTIVPGAAPVVVETTYGEPEE